MLKRLGGALSEGPGSPLTATISLPLTVETWGAMALYFVVGLTPHLETVQMVKLFAVTAAFLHGNRPDLNGIQWTWQCDSALEGFYKDQDLS